MITENRHRAILETLSRQGSATVQQLAEELGTSESTIRRDLTALDSQGRLRKVHGGATKIGKSYLSQEADMLTKEGLYTREKKIIGRSAAALIKKDDFVYIDAGTTTLQLAGSISGDALEASYVTNGLAHTQVLARKGCTVYVPSGRIKPTTEVIIGTSVLNSFRRFNFTKAFMGTNGISIESGFTTPGIEEAELKMAAVNSALECWILADESKFGKVYSAGFCDLIRASIITNRLPDRTYLDYTTVREAEGYDLYGNI